MLVAVNPSVQREPHTALAKQTYVLVLCPCGADEVTRPSPCPKVAALISTLLCPTVGYGTPMQPS